MKLRALSVVLAGIVVLFMIMPVFLKFCGLSATSVHMGKRSLYLFFQFIEGTAAVLLVFMMLFHIVNKSSLNQKKQNYSSGDQFSNANLFYNKPE